MPIKDVKNVRLTDVKLRDRPHLLLWDTANNQELQQLAYREDAECISYRTHLLSRLDLQSSGSLALHCWVERELDAIKAIGTNTSKPVVLLQDLDCLITYLHVQPESPITLFWQNLLNTRHLESILWIVLPSQLVPPDWDESRLQRI